MWTVDREHEGVSRHVALRTSAALLLTTVYDIWLPGEVLFLIFVSVKVDFRIASLVKKSNKNIRCIPLILGRCLADSTLYDKLRFWYLFFVFPLHHSLSLCRTYNILWNDSSYSYITSNYFPSLCIACYVWNWNIFVNSAIPKYE